jgi:NAD+ synthase (glutamine-hydrolysing)
MGLDGVEIFTNSSASHHELRKLNRRIDLMKEATQKVSYRPCCIFRAMADTQLGGIYLYANQQGCDGDRLYYDGACLIALNGQILAQGSQFSLSEVEVVTATIDLEAVRAQRMGSSRRMQSAQSEAYERIRVDMRLDGGHGIRPGEVETKVGQTEVRYHTPEEEIA